MTAKGLIGYIPMVLTFPKPEFSPNFLLIHVFKILFTKARFLWYNISPRIIHKIRFCEILPVLADVTLGM